VSTAPKVPHFADADAIPSAEGRIRVTVRRGHSEPPESPDRGALSKGFGRNLGELLISFLPHAGMVPPDPNGPGPGIGRDAPIRGAKKHLAEEVPEANTKEASGMESGAVVRPS
jgi:hypothetical protein